MAKSHWSDSSDPRKFQRGLFGAATVWIITSCLFLGALGVVGWQVGWWFKAEKVDRLVDIDNRNTGVQTAWHDQAVDGVKEFYLIPEDNTAARGALRNQTCDLIGRLVNEYMTPNLDTFESKECK